ncbi:MAG TPA: TIGR00730 family Rossman fold protein [Balneolaceae bacterium]|nr:TIGR00730 family Rossman fold protein [Balneolaceae bacterium]
MSPGKRVCVFCASSVGNNPAFAKGANALGQKLASKNIDLVYGGGGIGLMNEVANGVLAGGGEVQGVVPEHLNKQDRVHQNITALHCTGTMHERKAMMAELSDAFIALPGGFGTFEELMESITWLQLGIHNKPVILFNIAGYYDQLISFIDHAVESGFILNEKRKLLKIANSSEECLEFLPF